MVFINEIEPEFPYSYRDISYLEENIDSGYSDVSGLSSPTSPCQLSPPPSPLRQNQSDAVPFVYYHPIVQYLLIPVPLYPSEPPAVVEQKPFIQEPYLPSPQPDVGQQSHACRLIKWSLPPPTVPFVPLPGWEPMPYGMEQFWQSAFAWFFRPWWGTTGHLWTFKPVTSPPEVDEWRWHTITYSAKVRFQCPYRHGWTSCRGRVVFWFRMIRKGSEIAYEALFKLYGQQCNRCFKGRQDFLPPLWYHEEIENAVRFLAMEVAKTYYGGEKLPVPRRVRQGNPSKDHHHDPSRCQACVEGLCVIRY